MDRRSGFEAGRMTVTDAEDPCKRSKAESSLHCRVCVMYVNACVILRVDLRRSSATPFCTFVIVTECPSSVSCQSDAFWLALARRRNCRRANCECGTT